MLLLIEHLTAARVFPRWQRSFRVCLILLLVLSATAAKERDENNLRVLFIGNSLTYVNDLPAIVAALAKDAKQKRLIYKMVAFPDFSLEDHWNQGDARKAISKDDWDVVVLQQGPSALTESRVLLREYVRRFAEEIRRVGAKPAVYMVWPSANGQRYFDGVIESHRLAAEDGGAMLFPAGAAWRAAIKRDPYLGLYSADGFHPSVLGSFLAALVIYEGLYGSSFVLPAKLKIESESLHRIELNPAQLLTLRAAASEALRN